MGNYCSGEARTGNANNRVKKETTHNTKKAALAVSTALTIVIGYFFYAQTAENARASEKSNVLPRVVAVARDFHCLFSDIEGKVKGGNTMSSEKDVITCGNKDGLLALRPLSETETASESVTESETKKYALAFELELESMVGDAPIRRMIPAIAALDRKVAAFVISIARKESSWGEHVPTKDGEDCYNYWGLKGAGSRGTGMGYACFATPEEAVSAVGKRIGDLVEKRIDTPVEMVIWKCGSSCAGHDPKGVAKWISDVAVYFNRIAVAGTKEKKS